MIDFACKKINLNEIIKCSFGLGKADIKILNFLISHKTKQSSNQILEKIRLDLSTIQRSLKKLHEKDLIKRFQENLNNGGYIYYYESINKSIIKKMLMDVVHAWTNKVEKEFDKW